MQDTKVNKLVKAISYAGLILIESGAETYRVEDTMNRIAKAYGAVIVDAYATPTLLIVSYSTQNGELVHNIKRVHTKTTDLSKIVAVNNLSRRISNELIPVDDFFDELEKIDHSDDNYLLKLFGAIICSFGFAFFFDGGIYEAILSAIIGFLSYLCFYNLRKTNMVSFLNFTISSCVLTFLSNLSALFLNVNGDIVTISALMLLVPGLAMTNAIKDSVNGDLVSGSTRAMEALFVAIAISLGSIIGLFILRCFI